MKYKEHWNSCYKSTPVTKLGWYEEESQPSLDLILSCEPEKSSRIFIAGSGSSTLIESLVKRGYKNIIANDISNVALSHVKQRLGKYARSVHWIEDDLLNPKTLNKINKVDVWHDRAVFHFFTSEADQRKYFSLLKRLLKPEGYAIMAAYNTDNEASKCSGLPVRKYNQELLLNSLGGDFKEVQSFEHIYSMPNGDKRKYIYGLYNKRE